MALSLVEKQMLEALETVRDYLTQGLVDRQEYYPIMATVRDAIKAGENKQRGCPSGLHSAECTCKEEKPGINKHYSRYGKRNK